MFQMIETAIALTAALVGKHPVQFVYDEKIRVVEVHAIGASTKDEATVVRGYQIDGESSRPVPCWALFRLEGISDIIILDDRESGAPRIAEGYKSGDKQMNPVYVQL